MVRAEFQEVALVRSYVDGSDLYLGDNLDEAKRVVDEYSDKCTMFCLKKNKSPSDTSEIQVTKFHANGKCYDNSSIKIRGDALEKLLELLE